MFRPYKSSVVIKSPGPFWWPNEELTNERIKKNNIILNRQNYQVRTLSYVQTLVVPPSQLWPSGFTIIFGISFSTKFHMIFKYSVRRKCVRPGFSVNPNTYIIEVMFTYYLASTFFLYMYTVRSNRIGEAKPCFNPDNPICPHSYYRTSLCIWTWFNPLYTYTDSWTSQTVAILIKMHHLEEVNHFAVTIEYQISSTRSFTPNASALCGGTCFTFSSPIPYGWPFVSSITCYM